MLFILFYLQGAVNALTRKQQDKTQRQQSRPPERPSRSNKTRETTPPLSQQQPQQQVLAFPTTGGSGGSLFAKENPFAQDYPSSVEMEPLAKKRRESSSTETEMKTLQQSDVDMKEGEQFSCH